MAKLTVKTISPGEKHAHDNTAVSSIYDFSRHMSNSEPKLPKYSTTSLRDKGLLVPARLALKRQRASLKPVTMKSESVGTDSFQIALCHADEFALHGVQDLDKYHTAASTERNQIHSTPHHPNSLRDDTPHTAATDVSHLYREKPSSSHPVSAQYAAQYVEDSGSPSPCSYMLPRKPCREKNAPAYTFGLRCLVEKNGGSRTGWQKQWFAHSDPYTTKVDFNRETVWPSPFHYQAKPSLGNQTSKVSFPAWSFAARLQTNPSLLTENNPSPDTYNTITAFQKMTATNTHITLKSRPGGTQISAVPAKGKIPGPGAHDQTKFLSNKHSAPKHSFGRRLRTSLRHDPYVNIVSPIEA